MDTGKTYTIKLNSGEELIAKVINTNSDYIEVTNPVSIAPTQQGMQMVPSMFTADINQEIRINRSSISLYAYTEQRQGYRPYSKLKHEVLGIFKKSNK